MKKIVGRKNYVRPIIAFVLLCSILVSGAAPFGTPGASVVSAASTLKLSTAKSLAVATSEKIESLDIQIDAKTAAKTSAIRSLRERERSMGTFRWSPLLNFKFPTNPNEAEAFEFQFKPTQLEYNIKTLEHKKIDQKLTEYESVSNIYIDIITYTAEISFLEQRLRTQRQTLLKNKARVVAGLTTQEVVDQQQKTIDGLENDLTKQKKGLLRAQEKLGKKIGFSVTSGYTFEEEFIATNMNSDTVETLQSYAIDNDHTVFEARQEMELAEMTLEINYDLMRRHYGGNINMISSYIDQIQSGGSVDKRAFKKDYDSFLTKIDEPWSGSWRILFFKFPKEWLKGDLDGVRYIEDDPYVLYTAALDYQAALKEYNGACDELRGMVSDGYDAMMDAREAYATAQKNLASDKALLLDAEAKNAIGTLSYEEYDSFLQEYEDSRSALKDALSTYSKSLYSFDKTTCGAASAYFAAESLSVQTGGAGQAGVGNTERGEDVDDALSRMSAIVEKGATYSIRSIVSKEEFILYVDIPANFDYAITHFELWSDKRQIGARTSVDSSIRHLKLSVQEVDNVFIRLYNGTEFVDDCAIDPTASYGPLNITTGYETDDIQNRPVIGSYTVEDDANIDMIRLRFTFDQTAVHSAYQLGTDVAYYNMAAEKSLYLFTNELVDAEEPFTYMSFIKGDLGKLTLRLFDAEGTYIGGAKLDPDTKNLYVDEGITNEDMQKMAARQLIIRERAAEKTQEKARLLDLYNAAKAVNGGEGDSAAMTYYKQRMEEIDAEIALVAAEITDTDIEAALAAYPQEIADAVKAMARNDEGGLSDGLSAEEENARDTILYNAAKDLIPELRKQVMQEEIQKSINEKWQEYNEKYREYEKAAKENDQTRMENLKKELDSIQKEINAYEEKKDHVTADDREVTDEEISQMLQEYGDLIYSKAADQLSDAMLYGSPTGQWALAYLESQGYDTGTENMRAVVANVDSFQAYDALMARKKVLQAEYEKALAQAKAIGYVSETVEKKLDGAENSCGDQIVKMAKAYQKEIASLDKQIADIDPGKKLKQ